MDGPDPRDRPDPDATAPSLEEALRQLGQTGKAGLGSSLDVLRALKHLIVADLALARAALARALVWLTVAVAFGATAWLLVMGATIALLQALGWSWLASIGFAALVSLAVAGVGAWQALRYFELSRLDATRRQLARLGIGDGDGDESGTAPSRDDGTASVPPSAPTRDPGERP